MNQRQGVHYVGDASLSQTLCAFLQGWQPRQRRTLGMLATIITRLQAVINVHPNWGKYDLWTHLLAALHLIIENDRLTGGHTEDQIVAELAALVAAETPDDDPATHRAIAEAVVDVLTNTRERRRRLHDTYLDGTDGSVQRRVQTFAFVRAVGDEESAEYTLRATPEAVNVFQNLYQFDPSDRAAAERYRSERMLDRHEYDEVLTSVYRRSTAVHGLGSELEGLVRRINYNVKDVDYAAEVIPRLDEVIGIVREQVSAEERFAEIVADLTHHAAPDLVRLQRINHSLGELVNALGRLQSIALSARRAFEAAQDRQLFTYRRLTISPKAQLLEPLLNVAPGVALELLEGPLKSLLGPRPPTVTHFGNLVDRLTPSERAIGNRTFTDPFEVGGRRSDDGVHTPALLAAIARLLSNIERPTRLSNLLDALSGRADLKSDERLAHELPWALAIALANAYGHPDEHSGPARLAGFDHSRLAVIAPGEQLPPGGSVGGTDLVIIPLKSQEQK